MGFDLSGVVLVYGKTPNIRLTKDTYVYININMNLKINDNLSACYTKFVFFITVTDIYAKIRINVLLMNVYSRNSVPPH